MGPWWNRLNPLWWLSNADRDYDPHFKPEPPHRVRKFLFAVRNPGHNFTHYVIGLAHRPFKRVGFFPDQLWPESGKWNFAFIKYESEKSHMVALSLYVVALYLSGEARPYHLVLALALLVLTETRPFVAYRGDRFEWYIGWRQGGNFGIALRRKNAR